MGTRGYQRVITKEGDVKIRQYNQWDSYPSGQGIEILEYFKNGDLAKYQENLKKIPVITEEQSKEIDKDEIWVKNYPYLSRDCGSKIHLMIENGEVKFVSHIDDEEANSWCMGFYTIDFSKNEFTSEFNDIKHTFKLDALPTKEEYLEIMEPNKDE